MYRFTVEEIIKAVTGELLQGDPAAAFSSVSTDTRQVKKGDLFIALIGERFDAHDFIGEAIEGGAAGIIAGRRVDTGDWQGPVILMKDTLKALQDLARYNRSRFAGPVVAITGSNGKTTTKDMMAAVLEQQFTALKTEGNFNNEIGLPLTLLKLDDNYGAVILEMGMRGMGEIDLLAGIAMPSGAVITNIGETHLERLGTVDNIARAKGELLQHIQAAGFAVLNGDDPRIRQQASRCGGRIIFYGTAGDALIKAVDIVTPEAKRVSFTAVTPDGEVRINLPVPGRHNVLNALAAVGVGLEMGLTLEQIRVGLENTKLTAMRLAITEGRKITIIDDTYNANPASVKAALQILADLGGSRRKVAILGDMYELGSRAAEGHREVGMEAAAQKVDVLITVGRLAGEIALGASMAEDAPAEIISLNNNAEVKTYLERIIRPGDVVLVKGSRGMKMEEIVNRLKLLNQ